MPQTGPMILRTAREKAGMTREQLAERFACLSPSTIKRWEYGEVAPDSADVARLGDLVGDETVWLRYMTATDAEYAKHHPYTDGDTCAAMALVRLGYAIEDVQQKHGELVRELLAGKPSSNTDWMREKLSELESASRAARMQLKKGGCQNEGR